MDDLIENSDTVPQKPSSPMYGINRDNRDIGLIKRPQTSRAVFSENYKLSVFELWYRSGKPTAKVMYNLVEPDPVTGDIPTFTTLQTWMKVDFVPHADMLDQQVQMALEERLIQEKVAMFEKHAKIAVDLQEMAITYLDENQDNLKVPNAVRMLIEGVRIERESRGIPQALEKMMNRTDEELLKEVTEIVSKAPVTIEPLSEE